MLTLRAPNRRPRRTRPCSRRTRGPVARWRRSRTTSSWPTTTSVRPSASFPVSSAGRVDGATAYCTDRSCSSSAQIKEAIQDALSTKPIDPRLPRHGPLASQHWRTTFESTLTTRRALGYDSFIPPPPRLPDADDLARHLGALHADFERWYAPRLAGVVRSLEREKDEALARLALWRGRRPGLDEKGEWEPEANIDGALDGLLGHAPCVFPPLASCSQSDRKLTLA